MNTYQSLYDQGFEETYYYNSQNTNQAIKTLDMILHDDVILHMVPPGVVLGVCLIVIVALVVYKARTYTTNTYKDDENIWSLTSNY